MPEMDGIEASKRIRENEKDGRHTPIVALTAFALQGDRERFISLGMDGYIPKPVKMEELFLVIDRVCERNKRQIDFNCQVKIGENGELSFVREIRAIPKEELKAIICEITGNIEKLSEAIIGGSMPAIESTAHLVKNLLSQVDAEEMKDIAFKIELASRHGNLTKIIEYATQLKYKFETYRKSMNL
jgi:CheY-like chemotaxis protein